MGKKGYIFIIILTYIHGTITNAFLGSMPIVTFGQKIDVFNIAVGSWWIYAALIYLYIKREAVGNSSFKKSMGALLYGGIFTVIKIVLDILVGIVGDSIDSMIILCYIEGIYILLIGMVLIFFTFTCCGKKKIKLKKSLAAVPIFMICLVFLFDFLYMKYHFNIWEGMIPSLDALNREVEKLDYYYASRVLDSNVLSYVVCFPLFWWLITKSIVEEGNCEL